LDVSQSIEGYSLLKASEYARVWLNAEHPAGRSDCSREHTHFSPHPCTDIHNHIAGLWDIHLEIRIPRGRIAQARLIRLKSRVNDHTIAISVDPILPSNTTVQRSPRLTEIAAGANKP
jgi:hypothetical protein